MSASVTAAACRFISVSMASLRDLSVIYFKIFVTRRALTRTFGNSIAGGQLRHAGVPKMSGRRPDFVTADVTFGRRSEAPMAELLHIVRFVSRG